MSRLSRNSLLAIAATAALALTALTPTNASAFGHGGFHGVHGYRGQHFGSHLSYRPYHFGFGHWGWNRYHWGFEHRYRWSYPGYRYRWWYPRYGYGFGPRYRFPRPIVYGGIGGGAMAAASAAPAAAQAMPAAAQQANCLVKRYLPNGAVEFADMCTQEQAIAMPNGQPGPGPR